MATTWDEILAFALTLPDTVESTSYGTPAAKVRGRLFLRSRPEDDAVVVLCTPWEKEALLQSGDPAMFTTPHYDGHPYILLKLSEAALDAEIEELLTEAWRIGEGQAKRP
ncbi:MAG: MmcQ/YjbR family DNA-binding protein [Aeromicrobium sp.]